MVELAERLAQAWHARDPGPVLEVIQNGRWDLDALEQQVSVELALVFPHERAALVWAKNGKLQASARGVLEELERRSGQCNIETLKKAMGSTPDRSGGGSALDARIGAMRREGLVTRANSVVILQPRGTSALKDAREHDLPEQRREA